MQTGLGAYLSFNSNVSGTASLSLDISGDGDFDDPSDRVIFQNVNIGDNLIYWDGKDGQGNILQAADDINMAYLVEIRGGETHILLTDVENNKGGVTFQLSNSIPGITTDLFYYDHTFSKYAVSTAFPQTTIRSGITLRYNFGN